MRRVLSAASAAALVIGIFAGPALATVPGDPGCFGQARAFYSHLFQESGLPGASEQGVALSARAGDNGTINREYMADYCGWVFTP